MSYETPDDLKRERATLRLHLKKLRDSPTLQQHLKKLWGRLKPPEVRQSP